MHFFSSRLLTHALFAFFLLTSTPALLAETTLYVWEFAWRSGEEDALTQSVTQEFEETLAALRDYRIVEGQPPGSLKEQLSNIASIRTILDVPESTRQLIDSYEVDQVIIGELFDDVNNGEVVISVTLQRLDGSKTQSSSVSVSKGKIRDQATRIEKLKALANRLSSRSRPVHEASGLDYRFRIQECLGAGRTITCKIELLNDGEDREVTVYGSCSGRDRYTFIIDEFNSTFSATNLRLGNQIKRSDYCSISSLLVSGIPTRLILTFDSASSSAQSIALLDLKFEDSESRTRQSAKFRNVRIDRTQ